MFNIYKRGIDSMENQKHAVCRKLQKLFVLLFAVVFFACASTQSKNEQSDSDFRKDENIVKLVPKVSKPVNNKILPFTKSKKKKVKRTRRTKKRRVVKKNRKPTAKEIHDWDKELSIPSMGFDGM